VRAASSNQTVELRHPNSIRPWQHVLEPLYGYLLLGEKLLAGDRSFAEAWNFGPSPHVPVSVVEVVKMMQAEWNQIKFRITAPSENYHEAKLLLLDITKSCSRLQWLPRWDMPTTVQKTVQWYESFYSKKDILSSRQIGEYMDTVKPS
jgi:CDP-glucose 4,6-dehydratase